MLLCGIGVCLRVLVFDCVFCLSWCGLMLIGCFVRYMLC